MKGSPTTALGTDFRLVGFGFGEETSRPSYLSRNKLPMAYMNGTSTPSGAVTPRTGAGYTESTRPLVLQHPTTQTRITVLVNSKPENWTAAEVARESFLDLLIANADELVGFDEVEVTEDDDAGAAAADQNLKQLVLASHFLAHLAHLVPKLPAPTATVLLSAFVHFHEAHLAYGAKDIHSLAAALDAPVRALVISSYYAARTALEEGGRKDELPIEAESALLEAAKRGDKELYALFGGQGMNEVYWDELSVSYTHTVLKDPRLMPQRYADFVQLVPTSASPFPHRRIRSTLFPRSSQRFNPTLQPRSLSLEVVA